MHRLLLVYLHDFRREAVPASCVGAYYLVQATGAEHVIRRHARIWLRTDCKQFCFGGTWAQAWENGFDAEDVAAHLEDEVYEIMTTVTCPDLADMREQLLLDMAQLGADEHVLLVWDDPAALRALLQPCP